MCNEWQHKWAEDGIGYFVVSRKDEKGADTCNVIGFCGVRKSVEQGKDVLNVYYRFSPESQGKGFAKEATTAAIEWGREKCPDLPVVAIIDPANTASIRLAEKLGLTLDAGSGVPGDYDVYRL
ncbi:GNAT family N-acetyltransferase [Corynebacterium casei]|uniref:GNAT family N-acetyltransferase n=1 Tax=Corynebacterium casei TaxID=160386 RepID=UPI003FD59135